MQKLVEFWRREDGQSIIVVTLALFVLIALAALAIDVGSTYADRRQMQNAADAGALAGARELCLRSSADVAKAKAIQYMTANNAATTAATVSGNVVNTTAGKTASTPLASALGWSTINVDASAGAACGRATAACGLFPVAFSQSIWQQLYSPNGETCKPTQIAVWDGDNKNQTPICVVNGVEQYNICKCYNCDLNKDGKDDFAVVTSQGRAWLDFSEAILPYTDSCTASGCGASELACEIRNGSGSRIDLPKCISGDNGIKAGVKDDVNSRAGQNLSIALYDSLGCSTSNCPGGNTFHVTSFGCITMAANSPWGTLPGNLDPLPAFQGNKDYTTINKNVKIIWANVNCSNSCTSTCGGSDGTQPKPWELTAVSLTK